MRKCQILRGTRLLRCHTSSAVPVIALFLSALLLSLASAAQAAAVPVPLGTAEPFVVLAGAGITNTGPTTLNGDIGTFPTRSITGKATLTVNGSIHAADAVARIAKDDLREAYNTAAGEQPPEPIAGDLGGQKLTSGVYKSASSIGLTGTLTLDAQGDPNSVFVFQAGTTLTTASASRVLLVNGAQACNVYWQIGSSATLGTNSTFIGTILALQSITLTTGATVDGRVLARNGAVTLDTNVITKPTCATDGGTTGGTDGGTTGATDGGTTGAATGGATAGTSTTGGGILPSTGSDAILTGAGVLGVLLTIGGAAMLAARRRREA